MRINKQETILAHGGLTRPKVNHRRQCNFQNLDKIRVWYIFSGKVPIVDGHETLGYKILRVILTGILQLGISSSVIHWWKYPVTNLNKVYFCYISHDWCYHNNNHPHLSQCYSLFLDMFQHYMTLSVFTDITHNPSSPHNLWKLTLTNYLKPFQCYSKH